MIRRNVETDKVPVLSLALWLSWEALLAFIVPACPFGAVPACELNEKEIQHACPDQYAAADSGNHNVLSGNAL